MFLMIYIIRQTFPAVTELLQLLHEKKSTNTERTYASKIFCSTHSRNPHERHVGITDVSELIITKVEGGFIIVVFFISHSA